jgi:hypothetical protein
MPIKPSAKIEALIGNSIPKIMQIVRDGENLQEQMQAQKQQQDTQLAQQKLQQEQQMQQAKMQFDADQKERDRQAQIEIATIRALGGLQSDGNADGKIDATENLDGYFKQQEMADVRKSKQDELNQKRQDNIDSMTIEREKMQADLEKEKIKSEAAIKIAKENKSKYDKK